MTWNQSFLTDTWLTYSASPKFSFTARHMKMQMKNGESNNLIMPQLNHLLKRWNEYDLQANIYLYGGYGLLKKNQSKLSAGLIGIEADAEDRNYYIAFKYESMIDADTDKIYQTSLRLGIAPYISEHNELTSWLIVQLQYHPELHTNFAITPMARLFYKTALIEIGSSLEGQWLINLMFHF